MRYLIYFTKEFFSDFFSRLTVFSKVLLFFHVITLFIPVNIDLLEDKSNGVIYGLIIWGYVTLIILFHLFLYGLYFISLDKELIGWRKSTAYRYLLFSILTLLFVATGFGLGTSLGIFFPFLYVILIVPPLWFFVYTLILISEELSVG